MSVVHTFLLLLIRFPSYERPAAYIPVDGCYFFPVSTIKYKTAIIMYKYILDKCFHFFLEISRSVILESYLPNCFTMYLHHCVLVLSKTRVLIAQYSGKQLVCQYFKF